MKIAIGSDGSGFELKEAVRAHLDELGVEYVDFTPEAKEYYDVVPALVPRVQSGEFDRGLLFCGTGMGMAQMANSYKGIRAAVCESVSSATLCRAINNSNILTMGGFLVSPWIGCQMVDAFLHTEITDGLDAFHDFLLDAQKRIAELEDTVIY